MSPYSASESNENALNVALTSGSMRCRLADRKARAEQRLDAGMRGLVDVRREAGARRVRIIDGQNLVAQRGVVAGHVPVQSRIATQRNAAQAGLHHHAVHGIERSAAAVAVVHQLEGRRRLVDAADARIPLGAFVADVAITPTRGLNAS